MKIFHIMAAQSQGGAEIYSTDVMLSLHAAHVDQCVVMSDKAPRFNELKAAGLHMAPSVLRVPFQPLQRFLLARLIAREKPDIIHCWMRRAASLVSQSAAKGVANERPIIGWFGGYYDPSRFRYCSDFVGVTKDIVAHMIKKGVASRNAFFIPTFPDIATLPPIDRASVSTTRDAKVLLTLSRFHPKKGLDTLLSALAGLPDCILWLAGDGPLREALAAQARALGVDDRVRFLGWRTDRAALLRAADICVLPSRYEPFGTVILEAWAAGTPLVACRSAGPAAHIDDGRDGLLTPIDDVEGLRVTLRRALDDGDLRRRLVAHGYATYLKSYTRESVTDQWIQLYRKLRGH